MLADPGIVYFGTTNTLSKATLETLIAAGTGIRAVVVSADVPDQLPEAGTEITRLSPPAAAGDLPIINRHLQPSLLHVAWMADVPVYSAVSVVGTGLSRLLRELQAEVCCVACFPTRLPPDLISIPTFGFLNVHPSLLPHYRGPAPLFWLFRQDDLGRRGVTVHQMDAGLDTGPVLCQRSMTFPDGHSQAAIERDCGEMGGKLLLEAIRSLASGAKPRPQPPGGSYHPWPTADDYFLHASWSARRAFNFMRATNGHSVAYPLSVDGRALQLIEALDFRSHGQLSAPLIIDHQTAWIQFNPGILAARISLLS